MALAELFLVLELLDGVKQRDGVTPSDTPDRPKQREDGTFFGL